MGARHHPMRPSCWSSEEDITYTRHNSDVCCNNVSDGGQVEVRPLSSASTVLLEEETNTCFNWMSEQSERDHTAIPGNYNDLARLTDYAKWVPRNQAMATSTSETNSNEGISIQNSRICTSTYRLSPMKRSKLECAENEELEKDIKRKRKPCADSAEGAVSQSSNTEGACNLNMRSGKNDQKCTSSIHYDSVLKETASTSTHQKVNSSDLVLGMHAGGKFQPQEKGNSCDSQNLTNSKQHKNQTNNLIKSFQCIPMAKLNTSICSSSATGHCKQIDSNNGLGNNGRTCVSSSFCPSQGCSSIQEVDRKGNSKIKKKMFQTLCPSSCSLHSLKSNNLHPNAANKSKLTSCTNPQCSEDIYEHRNTNNYNTNNYTNEVASSNFLNFIKRSLLMHEPDDVTGCVCEVPSPLHSAYSRNSSLHAHDCTGSHYCEQKNVTPTRTICPRNFPALRHASLDVLEVGHSTSGTSSKSIYGSCSCNNFTHRCKVSNYSGCERNPFLQTCGHRNPNDAVMCASHFANVSGSDTLQSLGKNAAPCEKLSPFISSCTQCSSAQLCIPVVINDNVLKNITEPDYSDGSMNPSLHSYSMSSNLTETPLSCNAVNQQIPEINVNEGALEPLLYCTNSARNLNRNYLLSDSCNNEETPFAPFHFRNACSSQLHSDTGLNEDVRRDVRNKIVKDSIVFSPMGNHLIQAEAPFDTQVPVESQRNASVSYHTGCRYGGSSYDNELSGHFSSWKQNEEY